MPVTTSSFAAAFKADGPRGVAFFSSISPPGKDFTLHALLLDSNMKAPTMTQLSQSMGHRVSKAVQGQLAVSDVFLPASQRLDYVKNQFEMLNDATVDGVARLQSLHDFPVGAVLIVSKGAGEIPFITIVATPTITPFGSSSVESSAPIWEEAFESQVVEQFITLANAPTHGVLGSMGWKTRLGGVIPREDLIPLSQPVMLTPHERFGSLEAAGEVFHVLLLPELCSPPVGLFWPVDTKYDDFLKSLRGCRSFAPFLEVCQQSMVKAWFDKVNAESTPFLIHMADATALWTCLPTASNPDGNNVIEMDAVAPFQQQFDRFLWAIHCDRIQRAPMLVSVEERRAFGWYLKHGDACFPVEGPYASAPVTHRAFFATFFHPQLRWPDKNLTLGFAEVDRSTEVPALFRQVEPMQVPLMAYPSFKPKRLDLQPKSNSWDEYLKLLQANTDSTPGPSLAAAPGPRDTAKHLTVTPSPNGDSLKNRIPSSLSPSDMTVTPVINVEKGTIEMEAVSQQKVSFQSGLSQGSPQEFSSAWTQGAQPQPGGLSTVYSPAVPTVAHQKALDPSLTQRNLFGAPGRSHPASSSRLYATQVIPDLTMKDAALIPVSSRQRSPAIFLDLCFLLCHNIEEPSTRLQRSDLSEVLPHTVVLLRQPCAAVRQVLHEMSTSKDLCTGMRAFLHGRLLERSSGFADVSLGHLFFCTAPFVANAYTIRNWDVSLTRPPMADASTFTPLAFNRALNPQYPVNRVPQRGYSRHEASRLGKIIYIFYSYLDLKMAHGRVDDRAFQKSLFGSFLKRWAAIPTESSVDAIWSVHQERCSVHWILHLIELFAIFQELIIHRQFNGPTGGIEELQFFPSNQTLVVGSNLVQGDCFQDTGTLQQSLERLHTKMMQVWSQYVSMGPLDTVWKSPFATEFVAPTDPMGSSGSKKPGGSNGGGDSDPSDPKKRPRQNFIATTPTLIFKSQNRRAEKPFEALRAAGVDVWPKMQDAQGKQRHLCFSCLFASPYNQCDDADSCGLRGFRRRQGKRSSYPTRMHIDLNDPKWNPSAYPEANWDPLVQFVKKFNNIIAPTDALRKLTPGTKWD